MLGGSKDARGLDSDSGVATAEFAVILPVVVALAALMVFLGRAVAVGLDCQDAARSAAREIVLAGDAGDPSGVARAVAGERTAVSLDESDDRVLITTHCPVFADPMGVLPGSMSGTAIGVKQ